jgi:hypothetical protein
MPSAADERAGSRTGLQLFERDEGAPGDGAGAPASALPVVLLGANVWLAGVLWPLLATAETAWPAYAAAAACLLPLIAGAFVHTRAQLGDARARTWSAASWLAVFPVACGAVMTAWPQASERALGTPGLVLLWLSLCVFGAAAARACGIRPQPAATAEQPLPDSVRPGERAVPRRLRSATITLCAGGGAALALLAPDLGGLAPDADASARAGLVLASVVGGALGCTVVAVFLASGLRAEAKPSEPRLDGNLKAAWFLFVALLGGVVYHVVQP